MKSIVLSVVLASAPAAWSQTLDQGLQGYWKLDESAGPSSADSSGNGFNGTWVGGVTAVPPGNGTMTFSDPYCGQFDGTTSYVTVPTNPTLEITGDITVALWVYPTASPADWTRLVGKGNASTRTYGIWRHPSNSLLWQSVNPNIVVNLNSSALVPNNAWTHVCCTISGTSATIYVNGLQDMTTPISGSPVTTPSDPVTIGRAIAGSGATQHNVFQGRLDEVRIYNRALTPTEIAALAAGQGASAPNPPTGLHQYDQATGGEVFQGGSLSQPSMSVQATVSSPASANVGLEIEVQPVGTDFNNAPNRPSGALVASGGVASVAVTGLGFNTDYHHQVRTVDSNGMSSGWICFGTNPDNKNEKDFGTGSAGPPPTVSLLATVSPATGSVVPPGGSMMDTKLKLQACVTDASIAQVRLEMELAPMGASFTGIPTAVSGMASSGSTVGAQADVVPGFYRIRYRSANSFGVSGSWVALGGSPDVVVIAVGSGGRGFGDAVGGVSGCGNCAGADPRPAIAAVALLGLLALLKR